MIRIAISGASGRMGQEVLSLLDQDLDFKLIHTIDPKGKSTIRDVTDLDPKEIDGIVDFSSPENTIRVAKWCAKFKKFLVSGTTGLSSHQLRSLKVQSRKIPLFWAPNMSFGLMAVKVAMKALGGLKGFNFQIEELHHIHKKDSPSGTAVALQDHLKSIVEVDLPPVISVRGGGIKGVHRILAMGESEVFTIEHQALDRNVFARGALHAVLWVHKKKPGFYNLEQMWKSLNP